MYFYCQFYCNIFYLTLPLPYPFLMKDGKVELDSRSGDGARGVGEGGVRRGRYLHVYNHQSINLLQVNLTNLLHFNIWPLTN